MNTDDDTFGSPGVAHMDKAGIAREHKVFGMKPQVGDRTAPSNFGKSGRTSCSGTAGRGPR